MLPAVLEYDITIRNHTITYQPAASYDHYVALVNHYCHNNSVFAFVGQMQPYISANGRLGRWDSPSWRNRIEIPATETFNSFGIRYVESTSATDICTFTTRDPMNDIIAAFNDLLFRSGIYIGSWANMTELIDSPFPINQSVRANRTRDQEVFHSDDRWFIAAAAVQILTMLLILPAYWGT